LWQKVAQMCVLSFFFPKTSLYCRESFFSLSLRFFVFKKKQGLTIVMECHNIFGGISLSFSFLCEKQETKKKFPNTNLKRLFYVKSKVWHGKVNTYEINKNFKKKTFNRFTLPFI